MRTRLLAIGLLASVLAGCTKGEVYPLGVSRVESRLRSMQMPTELGFGAAGGSDASIESVTPEAVTWRITERGATLGWLKANLEAVDLDHTRVDVDFRMADEVANGSRGKQKLMSAVGRVVLAEAIDAELEDRAYNRRHVQAQVAIYAIAHRDELRDFEFDESAAHEAMGSSDRVATAVGASHPEVAVELRQEEAEQRMAAASAPTLNLDAAKDD